ncbi:ATP sulfurylase (ATP:sulfate adenyltransferase) subunit 1 [Candidatus Blochmanniella floridana]|uniref:sulfate adenylyltransferase n=1 Tax=Blochmanniella floridana TaxID=203907 RepID=Q7VQG7_BLOFL|nr:ATP sulfurylase (ATP:sulfate adenyltransferase) subunit 1 [Candidatus Blochmannia floridanus]
MKNVIEKEIFNYGGIENYLYSQQKKFLLRFLTCGSVDDGKSTLIGRLLHDSQHIYDDQLSTLYKDNNCFGVHKDKLDLSLLMDGLQLERAQGITIDVAYRYFSTEKRKFIIIDTPGHEEYTRNMVTGASNSSLAILLIDACKGIRKQTRRHWFISVLMGIKYIVVVINKMDLVDYNREVFQDICKKYLEFNGKLSCNIDTKFIPISALEGDNVIMKSKNMVWYEGPTLFDILENVNIDSIIDINNQQLRFPVQCVIRDNFNIRGYSGTVSSGNMYVGQYIKVLPTNTVSCIKRIFNFKNDQVRALSGESITVTLTDDVDVSRGDIIIDSKDMVNLTQNVLVDVIWMKTESLKQNQCFDVKITTKFYRVRVKHIQYCINIHTFDYQKSDEIPYNGIGLVELLFEEPVVLDEYIYYPVTGSMIFVDICSNDTVGAGMVRHSINSSNLNNKLNNDKKYSEFEVSLHSLIRLHFPHWNVQDLPK